MSNSENWEKNVVSAGLISGDLAFPIVYCPELHFSEFASSLADMKNSVAVRLSLIFIKYILYYKSMLLLFRIDQMQLRHVLDCSYRLI